LGQFTRNRPVTNVRPTFTFTPLNAQYANPSAQLAAISKMASAGLPMPAFQMQSMTKGMPVTQQPVLVSTNPTTNMHQSQPVATSLIPTIHTNQISMTTGSVSSIKTTQSAGDGLDTVDKMEPNVVRGIVCASKAFSGICPVIK
jgi:hypothetical protein